MAEDTARFVITGVFDSQSLLASIDAAMKTARKRIEAELGQVGKNLSQEMTAGLSTATRKVKPPKETENSTGRIRDNLTKINADLFIAIKRVVLWGAASRLVFQTFEKLRASISDIVELNKVVTDIAKIRPTGIPEQAIKTDILNNAVKFGIAFKEIGETQRLFYQQGFKVAEVSKLTKAELLGVTAANLGANEAMELLISTMSVFDIEAEKSISILDKLQKVQANFAVSSQDLATALRRVGPVVEELGGNIDSVIGVITALKESTRKSGEFIGTALSTIFSRMLTPVGATALKGLGISINKTALELRPLEDILGDIAKKWEELSDQQKISLAFALGARRRYAQVMSLFQNYGTALEAAAVSQNAFGAAVVAQQKEVQSLSRQFAIASEKMKIAGMNIIAAFAGTNEAEDGLRNLAITFQKFATDVSKHAKGIANVLKFVGVVASFIALQATLSVLTKRFIIIFGAIKKLTIGFVALRTGVEAVKASSVGLTAILTGGTSIVASIMVLIGQMFIANKLFAEHKTKVEDLSDVYRDFATKTEPVKRVLAKYAEITKQFKDFAGPEISRKFLGADSLGRDTKSVIGYLRSLEGVAEDLNNVTLDQFQDALRAVYGESVNLKKAVEELSVLKGFLEATKQGYADVLEELQSRLANFQTSLLQIESLLQRDVNKDTLLKNLFGDLEGITDLMDKLQMQTQQMDLSKLRFGAFEAPITLKDVSVADIVNQFTELMHQTEGIFGQMTKDSGVYGENFAQNFVKGLLGRVAQLDPASTFLLGTLSPDEVKRLATLDGEAFVDALNYAVEATIKESNIRQITEKALRAQPAVNMLELLTTAGLTPEQKQRLESIKKLTETIGPKIFAGYAKRLDPLSVALDNLTRKAQEFMMTSGVLDIPDKITQEFKSIVTAAKNLDLFGVSLEYSSKKAIAFGKSLLSVQISQMSQKISKAFETLQKSAEVPIKIRGLEQTIAFYKEIYNSIKDDEKQAQRATNLLTYITNLQQQLTNLKADLEDAKRAADGIRPSLQKDITTLQNLISTLEKVNAAYALNTALIKANVAHYEQAIKSVAGFAKNFANIKFKFLLVDVGELDIATKLDKKIQQIRRNNQIDLEVLAKRKELENARFVALKSALETKYVELNQDQLGTNLSKDQLQLVVARNREYSRTLNNLKKTHTLSLNNLSAEEQMLKLKEQESIRIALANSLLEQYKSIYGDINALSENLASATADLVTNFQQIVSAKGGLKIALEPFSEAYLRSITDRLQPILTDIFRNVVEGPFKDSLKNLQDQMDQLGDVRTGITIADTIADTLLQRSFAIGEAMAAGFTAGTGIGVGMPSGVQAGASSFSFGNTRSWLAGYQSPFRDKVAFENNTIEKSTRLTARQTGILVNVNQSSLSTQQQSVKAQIASVRKQTAILAATQALGSMLGTLAGGGTATASMGSNLGGLIGSALFNTSPWGILGGSILGGIVGSLFGGKDKPEIKREAVIYEANTEALKQNTEAIIRNTQNFSFMRQLINAPSNFMTPAYAGLGGAMPVQPMSIIVEFNAPVVGTDNVKKVIYDAVSDVYANQFRRIGRRG